MTNTETKPRVRIHTVPLEPAPDRGYGTPHLQLPWSVRLIGGFKHNPSSQFDLRVFGSTADVEKWHGVGTGGPHSEHSLPDPAMIGCLSAQPSVIAAVYGREDYNIRLAVQPGDRLRTIAGMLEIRDDWRLHDPYVVLLDVKDL